MAGPQTEEDKAIIGQQDQPGSSSSQTAPKTKLKDHVYKFGAANQASEYVTNTRFIIAYIRKVHKKYKSRPIYDAGAR